MLKNVKVVFLGPPNAGKTSLTKRLTGKPLDQMQNTIGVDFSQRQVECQIHGQPHRFLYYFWDISGSETDEQRLFQFFKNLQICVIVGDLVSHSFLKEVQSWHDIVSKYESKHGHQLQRIMMCNKNDLS